MLNISIHNCELWFSVHGLHRHVSHPVGITQREYFRTKNKYQSSLEIFVRFSKQIILSQAHPLKKKHKKLGLTHDCQLAWLGMAGRGRLGGEEADLMNGLFRGGSGGGVLQDRPSRNGENCSLLLQKGRVRSKI